MAEEQRRLRVVDRVVLHEGPIEFATLADHNRFKSEQIVELSLPLVGDEIENGGGNK